MLDFNPTYEHPELSDALAEIADWDSGAPFALFLMALDRAAARVKTTGSDEGITRDAVIAELTELAQGHRPS